MIIWYDDDYPLIFVKVYKRKVKNKNTYKKWKASQKLQAAIDYKNNSRDN